jgi:hypothetical protein
MGDDYLHIMELTAVLHPRYAERRVDTAAVLVHHAAVGEKPATAVCRGFWKNVTAGTCRPPPSAPP